jgi:hypothetical protein
MQVDLRSRDGKMLVGYLAAAVLALFFGIAAAFSGPPPSARIAATPQPVQEIAPVGTPPPAATPTPAASPSQAVLAQATEALKNCAKTTNQRPVNCPQQSSRAPESGVTWSLHGDPSAGAAVLPSDSGTSSILVGHFVMVASWLQRDRSSPYKETVAGPFEAPIEGSSALGPMKASNRQLPPLQPDSRVTRDGALALVGQLLGDCHAATPHDWPTECPGAPSSVFSYRQETDAIDARGKLNGDASANANLGFDEKTGMSVLTGSYDMTVTWGGPQPGTKQLAGNYEAPLIWDGDHLSLLQVTIK